MQHLGVEARIGESFLGREMLVSGSEVMVPINNMIGYELGLIILGPTACREKRPCPLSSPDRECHVVHSLKLARRRILNPLQCGWGLPFDVFFSILNRRWGTAGHVNFERIESLISCRDKDESLISCRGAQ